VKIPVYSFPKVLIVTLERSLPWVRRNAAGGHMRLEKNVGKKEGIARLIIGLALLLPLVTAGGWLKWAFALAGVALIGTAFAHT
jgi:hypothetical protein